MRVFCWALLLLGLLPAGLLAQTAALLTWSYNHPKPKQFVIERSLDNGGTWQEVARVPGQRGTGITWQDTTLPAPPTAAAYRVIAVKGGHDAPPSNTASLILDGAGQAWACVSRRPDGSTVVLTCTKPPD